MDVSFYDPWVNAKEVLREYNVKVIKITALNFKEYGGVVLAVAHDEFMEMDLMLSEEQVIYDIKSVLINADATL